MIKLPRIRVTSDNRKLREYLFTQIPPQFSSPFNGEGKKEDFSVLCPEEDGTRFLFAMPSSKAALMAKEVTVQEFLDAIENIIIIDNNVVEFNDSGIKIGAVFISRANIKRIYDKVLNGSTD